ncbi:MAG: DUF1552 domain-containing protein [Planctomycetota bacterium]
MKTIPRRTFLRGLGTAMALPLLDGMVPSLRADEDTRNEGQAPRRLVFVFVPNGIHMQDWTPEREGSDFELPSTLAPLGPVKDHLLVLSGLTHDKARANGDGPGDHARSSACFLTGAQPRKTAGSDIHVGVSVDQVAAQAIGSATRFPSLELGCEPARQSGNCDSGYSCAYSSSISWRTPHSPMGKEIHPRLAFDRLFAFGGDAASAAAQAERRHTRRSILDFVRDDAARLERRLGRADRRKLDEYLTAVRELERRIDLAEDGTEADALDIPEAMPRDYRDHVRLMNDVLVLALRSDLTRIATFMFANEGSNRSYPFVGVRGGHHEISHHGGDRAKIQGIRTINRFHTSQLSYLLQALAAVEEGEGTLLDNCMLVYGSGISDGNRHNHDDLPILVAGRGGGTIAPGRHVRYPRETPLCNLFLSLLDRMGVRRQAFGDGTGRLPGLDA